MKVWKLTSPNQIKRDVAPDQPLEGDQVKIKITKALLSESDVAVYTGLTEVRYPIVPGRFALGQVTEVSEDSYLKKGDRVYVTETRNRKTGF